MTIPQYPYGAPMGFFQNQQPIPVQQPFPMQQQVPFFVQPQPGFPPQATSQTVGMNPQQPGFFGQLGGMFFDPNNPTGFTPMGAAAVQGIGGLGAIADPRFAPLAQLQQQMFQTAFGSEAQRQSQIATNTAGKGAQQQSQGTAGATGGATPAPTGGQPAQGAPGAPGGLGGMFMSPFQSAFSALGTPAQFMPIQAQPPPAQGAQAGQQPPLSAPLTVSAQQGQGKTQPAGQFTQPVMPAVRPAGVDFFVGPEQHRANLESSLAALNQGQTFASNVDEQRRRAAQFPADIAAQKARTAYTDALYAAQQPAEVRRRILEKQTLERSGKLADIAAGAAADPNAVSLQQASPFFSLGPAGQTLATPQAFNPRTGATTPTGAAQPFTPKPVSATRAGGVSPADISVASSIVNSEFQQFVRDPKNYLDKVSMQRALTASSALDPSTFRQFLTPEARALYDARLMQAADHVAADGTLATLPPLQVEAAGQVHLQSIIERLSPAAKDLKDIQGIINLMKAARKDVTDEEIIAQLEALSQR